MHKNSLKHTYYYKDLKNKQTNQKSQKMHIVTHYQQQNDKRN